MSELPWSTVFLFQSNLSLLKARICRYYKTIQYSVICRKMCQKDKRFYYFFNFPNYRMRRHRRKILFFGFENFRIKKELTLIFMLNKFNSHDISILPSSEVEIMAGLCTSQEQEWRRKTADETVLLVDACPNDDRLLTVIIFMKREMLLTLSLYLLPWRNFFNRQIKN